MKKLNGCQKVFGIGLSKTGTSSLGDALNILGINTIHFPHDQKTYAELTNGNYKLSILEEYQGIVDITVAPYYAQLDKCYPESKFILTIREKYSWLNSIKEHWNNMKLLDKDQQYIQFRNFIRLSVYGSLEFNEDRFLYVYETHSRNVIDYFKNRQKDFLLLDICNNDSWQKLCPFLGFKIPDLPFPHSNQRKDFLSWVHGIDLVAKDVGTVIPSGESFILVDQEYFGSKISPEHNVIPFIERNGLYWGPPPDDSTAIRELERLHQTGTNFIAFAWPEFWWFEYYSEFNRYLRSQFRCVLKNDRLVIFDLRKRHEEYFSYQP